MTVTKIKRVTKWGEVEAAPRMDLHQIHRVKGMLAAYGGLRPDGRFKYFVGWSDKRIADELGLTRHQVRGVRQGSLGRMRPFREGGNVGPIVRSEGSALRLGVPADKVEFAGWPKRRRGRHPPTGQQELPLNGPGLDALWISLSAKLDRAMLDTDSLLALLDLDIRRLEASEGNSDE